MGGAAAPPRAAWRDVPAVTFALFFPLLMTWYYFVVMHHQEQAQTNRGLIVAYSAGKAIQFLFPVAYIALVEPALLRSCGRRASPRGWLAGIGFGLAVAAAMLALYFSLLRGGSTLENTPAQLYSRLQGFNLATPLGFLGLAIFYCVVHSFLEEYYWRWFAFDRLQRYLPVAAAIILSSLGFMLHHVVLLYVYLPGQFWLFALPFSLAVAVGGAFWAWLYYFCGSLLPSWLSHLLIDAAIMLVGYDLLLPFWG
jgi:membrane protease YdiL (CAAX protease family)